MMGWAVAWKCLVACWLGEESQQPTCPQVRHRRKWTHGEPIFRHSSQPSALGVTSRICVVWVQTAVIKLSNPCGQSEKKEKYGGAHLASASASELTLRMGPLEGFVYPLWANSGHSVPGRFLRCSSSSRLLENNWAFLHITRAGSPGAGSHSIRWFISSRRSFETVRNGESDVSSSPRFRRYAQGAPQRRLQRARKRRGRRRVDGATQSGLVAICTAPRS